jgi:hypothetical protein
MLFNKQTNNLIGTRKKLPRKDILLNHKHELFQQKYTLEIDYLLIDHLKLVDHFSRNKINNQKKKKRINIITLIRFRL